MSTPDICDEQMMWGYSFQFKISGGTKGRRLNFQEQLNTNSEAKFLRDIEGKVKAGDHLLMQGELNPCRPGCQPKIRKFVLENGVSADYYSNTSHFNWVKETNSSVLQTVTHNGNSVTIRYTRNRKGKWRSRKVWCTVYDQTGKMIL